ncbi:MAG: hypothetical protein ACPHOL_04755 [Candidatus Puniceispirillum sp.]
MSELAGLHARLSRKIKVLQGIIRQMASWRPAFDLSACDVVIAFRINNQHY